MNVKERQELLQEARVKIFASKFFIDHATKDSGGLENEAAAIGDLLSQAFERIKALETIFLTGNSRPGRFPALAEYDDICKHGLLNCAVCTEVIVPQQVSNPEPPNAPNLRRDGSIEIHKGGEVVIVRRGLKAHHYRPVGPSYGRCWRMAMQLTWPHDWVRNKDTDDEYCVWSTQPPPPPPSLWKHSNKGLNS